MLGAYVDTHSRVEGIAAVQFYVVANVTVVIVVHPSL